ncbi:hypothetical protein OIU78_009555 [Salix suchowensis]|nr:hypothetical protein OIU78_009555 [Salix suchowensis]
MMYKKSFSSFVLKVHCRFLAVNSRFFGFYFLKHKDGCLLLLPMHYSVGMVQCLTDLKAGLSRQPRKRYGLVSRKSMTHFQEETQPLRRNMSSSGVESLGFGRKRKGIDSEDDNKLGFSELSDKSLTTEVAQGLNNVQPSSEDEDACPTCLDEYTPENPKITTRCSHHFHLGCIYEWLERSESCPICGKEMEFCESP